MALVLALGGFVACAASVSRGVTDGCRHPFENRDWGLAMCLPDPFTVQTGTDGGFVLLGPRTNWPFFDGEHRFMLLAVPPEPIAELTARLARPARGLPEGRLPEADVVTQVRAFREGSIQAVRFERLSRTAQCPEVVIVVAGPSRNYEFHYPNCGITDPEFHAGAEAYLRAVIRTMRFRAP